MARGRVYRGLVTLNLHVYAEFERDVSLVSPPTRRVNPSLGSWKENPSCSLLTDLLTPLRVIEVPLQRDKVA